MLRCVLLFSALLFFACAQDTVNKKTDTLTSPGKISDDDKPVCPKGDIDSIIPILYGLPTREAFEKSNRGELLLGGCIEDSLSPHWYCKTHKINF